jgi:hypothetical protein
MGQNIKTNEQQSTAYRLRQEIRYTESDITETVQSLEQKLSPRYLKERGLRKAKHVAWEGTAKLLGLAQRPAVQASLVGVTALWMLMKNEKVRHKIAPKKPAARELSQSGTAAKALGATALWLLTRKSKAGKPGVSAGVSGMALAATAAKAFLGGRRASERRGTTQPAKTVAWRGLATAIGGALSSYWYGHKGHRV